MTVVIVDDERFIVNGLTSMINSFSFANTQVIGYVDSHEALEYLRHNNVDVIIMDINMPHMSGLELMQSVREMNRDCSIVILTGHRNFEYAQRAIKLKAIEYLIKPIDENELYDILREAFRNVHKIYPEEYLKINQVEMEILERGSSAYSKHLESLIKYITSNLQRDVSLTKLSEISGLHPNYISSLFNKEMGMNYLKYVNGLRIVRALKILKEEPEIPIYNVAFNLGYSNDRQFYRIFKGLIGMTPGQYKGNL